MIFRSYLLIVLVGAFFAAAVQAGSDPFPIFRVLLISEDNPGKEVTVELYSLGEDGLFVRVDGKTIGKVVVIETDPKFVEKRYLANWDQARQQFRFTLQHRIFQDGSAVATRNWKMSMNNKIFSAASPEVKTFPTAASKKHKLSAVAVFAEKPGGITSDDLKLLLYPLPTVPGGAGITYDKDKVTGVRMVTGRFSVTSQIPVEHILAYIRDTALTNRIHWFSSH